MEGEDTDVLVLMTDAFLKQERALSDVRRDIYSMLVEEAWRVAIRSRHYLTAQYLEAPCNSAWMLQYKSADGCIIWSRHNCPGSWNDSDTSLGFRMKILDPKYCPSTKMNVVSDSAFPCSTAMGERILTPLKDEDIDRILPSLRSSARSLHNAITSVRQAVEWGMGSVQKVSAGSTCRCRTTPSSEASA
ncbi:hypothetical protein PR003_g16104 [Phytophthora rubi]|uniref:DDE Tnp4 domain-containing protein n=1 Tax=Phytophthora rubi TaxID=129364 RepID=A0A6A4F2A3_9STRA|nr:hypothetical protein PR003_g16104 [Phytophthora rubi]